MTSLLDTQKKSYARVVPGHIGRHTKELRARSCLEALAKALVKPQKELRARSKPHMKIRVQGGPLRS